MPNKSQNPKKNDSYEEIKRLRKELTEAKKNAFIKKRRILCEENRLGPYQFIQKNNKEFGLRWLLKRFNIDPNAYYNYLKDRKYQYHEDKARVERKIVGIYHKNDGVPGYRMMRDYLEQCSIHYSRTTVYKYMNELGLRSVVRRKKPYYVKGTVHKAFSNLLNQNFKVDVPNKIWCADFTYFPQKDGTIRYNCTMID